MPGKLAVVGMGRMGRAIAELAPERGWTVVATLDQEETRGGITREALAGAEVAVEFTMPSAAVENVRGIVAAGCAVVVGTTGWYADRAALEAWVRERGGTVLIASNFSVGVAAFERIVATAARLLAGAAFDAQAIEMHHAAKKDKPSGTALTLTAAAETAWGRPIPIASVRTGSLPGTHEFIFDAPFETIRLAHVARDRRVFAEGALVAAEWLRGRATRGGVFTMQDVVGGGS